MVHTLSSSIFDTFTTTGDDTAILKSIKQRQIQDLQVISMEAGRGTVGFKALPDTAKDARTSKGNALNWDSNTNSFDGEVDTFVDSNGNTVYKEATITIFETNFNDDSKNKFGVLKRFGIWDGGLTKSNTMTGTFSHEVFHNLDQKTISTVKQNSAAGKKVNSYDVQTPAYKVQGQVHQEIKSNRKKN